MAKAAAMNLVTAFFAASVIGMFEGPIEKIVALAILIPVVASIVGLTGSHTRRGRWVSSKLLSH